MASVKVLDFGLAKMARHDFGRGQSEDSPTISMAATQAGVILGTAAYMAPEQARGKPVDKRADIWAFGVVLYEMLTGKRLFEGEDLTETLAAVVKEEPDLNGRPREVRRLLERCLEKDPKKRLRDIGDVWELLDVSRPSAADAAPQCPLRSATWPGSRRRCWRSSLGSARASWTSGTRPVGAPAGAAGCRSGRGCFLAFVAASSGVPGEQRCHLP